MAEARTSLARRYLLGETSDDENSSVELEYVRDGGALDRMAAVEDELIEDYLAGRLDDRTRAQFEGHYLASAHHRVRVETVRRLADSAVPRQRFAQRRAGLLGLAAAAVLVLVTSVWLLRGGGSAPPKVSTASPATGANSRASAATPVIFAITIAVDDVRGQGDRPPVVVPAGTDRVLVNLENRPGGEPLAQGRATVRTVPGGEVWSGPAASGDPAILARFEVPAAALAPDDYVIDVRGRTPSGVEQQSSRYFLRVR